MTRISVSLETRKRNAELPDDWNNIMETARRYPSPFNIEKVTHDIFFDIKVAVGQYFLRNSKPAMKLKEVRMIKIEKEFPYVLVRYTFKGPWHRIMIRNKRKLPEALKLNKMYKSTLPLNPHKRNDLIKLINFLSNPASLSFYGTLLSSSTAPESTTSAVDIDNEDNSSGMED